MSPSVTRNTCQSLILQSLALCNNQWKAPANHGSFKLETGISLYQGLKLAPDTHQLQQCVKLSGDPKGECTKQRHIYTLPCFVRPQLMFHALSHSGHGSLSNIFYLLLMCFDF